MYARWRLHGISYYNKTYLFVNQSKQTSKMFHWKIIGPPNHVGPILKGRLTRNPFHISKHSNIQVCLCVCVCVRVMMNDLIVCFALIGLGFLFLIVLTLTLERTQHYFMFLFSILWTIYVTHIIYPWHIRLYGEFYNPKFYQWLIYLLFFIKFVRVGSFV